MKPVFTLILALGLAVAASPCSTIKYSVDGRTYFCGNEDWIARDPAIQTVESRNGDCGYVLFGWKSYLPRFAQAGMNTEGLCFDWAVVPSQPFVADSTKRTLSLDFTTDLLRTCRSVDEAVRYMMKYSIPHLAEEHLMLADRTGTSCVIKAPREYTLASLVNKSSVLAIGP